MLDEAGDGVESGTDISDAGKALHVIEEALNGGHGAADLLGDSGKTARKVSLVDDVADKRDEVLELAGDGIESSSDIGDGASQDTTDNGVDVVDGAGDGAQEASHDGEEAIGGVENGAEEATKVKTELTLLESCLYLLDGGLEDSNVGRALGT